ncbi:carbohydrate ABC transporter permease [Embleya sp. NPDC005971]|uniref:carbohydrate ABC transporter permease n=1 Tax=unclassified Embleya TaxID=2699296 RepID=UPI00341155E3
MPAHADPPTPAPRTLHRRAAGYPRAPRVGRVLRAGARHAVLLAVAGAMLFPVLWALITSFKPANDIYGTDPVPWPASLEHYRSALDDFPIVRLLVNTFVMAAGVTLAQLTVGVLAGYALVRFHVPLRGWMMGALAVALVVPTQSLIVPHFLMLAELGWRDSYPGLVLPQLSGCALAVLLLHEHVKAIPAGLLGAAALEGATPWETLRFVVLPLLRPALGAVAVLVFISTWNEYLWPLLAAPSREHTTIQVGLQLFQNQEGPNPGPLLAAAMLATLPVVAVYLFASRRVADAFLHSGLR